MPSPTPDGATPTIQPTGGAGGSRANANNRVVVMVTDICQARWIAAWFLRRRD